MINVKKRTLFSTRGSLAVETAIFLPLLIIGILTLGYIIKLVSIEDRVFHSFADETHLLAAQGNMPFKNATYARYEKDLKSRILEENEDKVLSAKVDSAKYYIPYYSSIGGRKYTSLIGASVVYKVDIPLPRLFKDNVTMGDTLLCRAFTGANNKGTAMPFSEMEEDKDSDKVWVFPRSGEKYHDENCGYIKNTPKEMMLSGSVKSSWKACELCKPNKAGNGTLVYCFPTSGKAYHLGSCYVVERYVVPISEESAKEKGYSSCSKCGG